jgi:c-di-GMP-binding flagellar brake protein YcgR
MDKKLFEKALKMPVNERVVFAELILASLDQENDEVRLAWLDEVNSRIKAAKEGSAKLIEDSEDLVDLRKAKAETMNKPSFSYNEIDDKINQTTKKVKAMTEKRPSKRRSAD